MQQGITAELFDWDEPWPWLEPGGRLGELERKIELAIERGEPAALDAATAAIELLDAIEGEPDAEPLDEREPEEPCTASYGIDQSKPVGWKSGRPARGFYLPAAWQLACGF